MRNGIKTAVASIDNIGGKEQVILGDYQRDLILRTKGSVRIQVNNKFYDILGDELATTSNNNGVVIVDTLNQAASLPNGSLVYTIDTSLLYVVYNGNLIPLIGNVEPSPSNPEQPVNINFISFSNYQNLSEGQINVAQKNIGLVYDSVDDLLATSWDKKFGFVKDKDSFNIILDGELHELFLSLLHGGVVKGKVTLSTGLEANNTLTVESVNATYNSQGFDGLFVGSIDSLKGVGIYSGTANFINSVGAPLVLGSNSNFTTVITSVNVQIGSITTTEPYTLAVSGISRLEDIIVSSTITSTLGTKTDGYLYDRGSGLHVYDKDDSYTLEIGRVIETSISEYSSLISPRMQTLLNPTTKIYDYDYDEDEGTAEVTVVDASLFTIGDVVIGLQVDELQNVRNTVVGTVTSLDENIVSINVLAGYISLLNVHLVNLSKSNVLQDTFEGSIINYEGVGDISDIYSYLNVSDLDELLEVLEGEDGGKIHLKLSGDVTISKLGELVGLTDDFLEINGTGFYSKNVFIKGQGEFSKFRLGDKLTYVNDILTIDIDGHTLNGDSIVEWDSAYSHSQSTGNPHGTTFSQIAEKPTTLAGYGIVDAMTILHPANNITSANITSWNEAVTNSHTHSNKVLLDGITDTNISNWDEAYNSILSPDDFIGAIIDTDFEVMDSSKGIILKSPDGTRWRITIGDDGIPITTAL